MENVKTKQVTKVAASSVGFHTTVPTAGSSKDRGDSVRAGGITAWNWKPTLLGWCGNSGFSRDFDGVGADVCCSSTGADVCCSSNLFPPASDRGFFKSIIASYSNKFVSDHPQSSRTWRDSQIRTILDFHRQQRTVSSVANPPMESAPSQS